MSNGAWFALVGNGMIWGIYALKTGIVCSRIEFRSNTYRNDRIYPLYVLPKLFAYWDEVTSIHLTYRSGFKLCFLRRLSCIALYTLSLLNMFRASHVYLWSLINQNLDVLGVSYIRSARRATVSTEHVILLYFFDLVPPTNQRMEGLSPLSTADIHVV